MDIELSITISLQILPLIAIFFVFAKNSRYPVAFADR